MQEIVLIKLSYCAPSKYEPLHSLADRFSAGDSRKQFLLQHNTNKPPEFTTNYLPAGLYYSAFSCPLNMGHLLLTETDHWLVVSGHSSVINAQVRIIVKWNLLLGYKMECYCVKLLL